MSLCPAQRSAAQQTAATGAWPPPGPGGCEGTAGQLAAAAPKGRLGRQGTLIAQRLRKSLPQRRRRGCARRGSGAGGRAAGRSRLKSCESAVLLARSLAGWGGGARARAACSPRISSFSPSSATSSGDDAAAASAGCVAIARDKRAETRCNTNSARPAYVHGVTRSRARHQHACTTTVAPSNSVTRVTLLPLFLGVHCCSALFPLAALSSCLAFAGCFTAPAPARLTRVTGRAAPARCARLGMGACRECASRVVACGGHCLGAPCNPPGSRARRSAASPLVPGWHARQ